MGYHTEGNTPVCSLSLLRSLLVKLESFVFFAKLGRIHRFGKVNFATNFYQKQLFSEKSTFLMQGFTIFAFIE